MRLFVFRRCEIRKAESRRFGSILGAATRISPQALKAGPKAKTMFEVHRRASAVVCLIIERNLLDITRKAAGFNSRLFASVS